MTIVSTTHSEAFQLQVLMDSGVTMLYTDTGYEDYTDIIPSLFWNEIKYKIPIPTLPVDTKLLVWNDTDVMWHRHFSHFDKENNCWCFDYGKTSFTTDCTSCWDNWKLYKEEEENENK